MGKLAAPLGYSSNTPNDKHTGDTINGKKVSARIAAHCRAAAACNAPNTAAPNTAPPENRAVFLNAASVSPSHNTRHAAPAWAA